jgi:hypothetical protein
MYQFNQADLNVGKRVERVEGVLRDSGTCEKWSDGNKKILLLILKIKDSWII